MHLAISQIIVGKRESATLRDRLARGASGMLALRFAFSGCSFLLTALLARLLGVEAFGVYSYALAWVVLISIPAVLGMDQLLVREVATCVAKANWGLLRGLLQGAARMVLLSSVGLMVVAGAIIWAFNRSSSGDFLPTMGVALMLLPLIALTQVRRGAMQGFHNIVVGSIPEQFLQPFLLLAFIAVASLSMKLTAPAAMGFRLLSSGTGFAVGTYLLYRTIPAAARQAAPVFQNSDWLRSSLPLMLTASIGTLFGQADTLILGALNGPRALSIYSVADKGAELMNVLVMVQNSAFASTAASLFATGDKETLRRLVTRMTRLTLLLNLPVAAVLIAFGRSFLTFCYGQSYAAAAVPLAYLTTGQLASVALGSGGMLLVMSGHAREALYSTAIGAVANIVLNLLWIPRWGQEGAAIANSVSLILLNILNMTLLHRKAQIWPAAFGSPSRPPSAAVR